MAGLNTFKTVVEQDRTELLLRYPFYGRVICQCELVPVQSPNAPIACNDCRHIYLLESAYMALSAEDRLMALTHEVLHITLRHAFRKGNRDEERFSFAADAEIYPLLREEFPQAELEEYENEWDGLTAEEIYELLPIKLPAPSPKHCYPSNSSQNDSNADMESMDHPEDDNDSGRDSENTAGSEDDPDDMETDDPAAPNGDILGKVGAQDESNNSGEGQSGGQEQDEDESNVPGEGEGQDESNVPGKGEVQGQDESDVPGEGEDRDDDQGDSDSSGNSQNGDTGKEANGTGSGSTPDSEDGDNGEKSSQKVEQPAFDANTEMYSRQLAAEVQLELKKRNGRGNIPVKFLRLLEIINAPSIDWRSLLRQFIREVRGGSYRWLPPNRRFISRGLYLPGRRQKMFRGVVALDTSGSTIEELPGFVSEVESLMRSFGKFEMTVIECDAEIGNVTIVSSNTKPYDWSKHRFSGGGGTVFFPVFEYIEDKRIRPDVLVFFTDGYAMCPESGPGYPVLWLLTENGKPPVPWGFHIKMKG